MTATELKRDVRVLQRSIIDLLEQITALIKQAGTVLGGDKGDGRYQQFQQEIANEALKVKNLELRMAIVAPMKAGKSTIVNSIIGQDILPSRASAMTTLPTEIVFEAERSEPVLVLSPELLRIFQETLHNLKQKIQDLDPKALKAKIATHPHLEDLLQEVQNAVGLPMHESVTGREEIVKTLTGLNDIIRICSLIAPVADPLQLLTDVPRIHTPFWKSDTTGQSENLGNLVIVDTPGPNEAGENLRLVHEVKKQLQKSSIVLIVLDFNGLNTKAAEEIKHDVQQVIQVRGKKNLYVLVNKVDQRREGDPMTPERVRQFVSADLGLGEIGDGDRVFEISARRAFSASNFMQELEQSPDASIQDLRTARPLAQEVFGIDWEEELEDATLDELQRKAERLWKKSGFAPFLDKAIGALMTEAAPRCIIDALTIADDRLKQLRNQVVLRSEALNADEEKLRLEVGALENSL